MSFSRPQQPAWQQMIREAWAAHCLREGTAPVPPKWARDWYEQELFHATGATSTADLGAGRDYDRAMAHFEVLGGRDIRWQMKLHGGDAVRILHELDRVHPGHGLDETYLRGVAKRMLRLDFLPELSRLTREQTVIVLGEVKRWLRRQPKAEIDIPF